MVNKIARKLIFAFSRLPFGVLFAISRFVSFVMYRVVRYRLKVVRDNLKRIFPEKDERELRTMEYKFYRHFSDYFFETLKLLTLTKEQLNERIVLKNPDEINQFLDHGQSVFLYAAHFGNWDWVAVFVNYIHTPILAFYQPQANALANELSLYARAHLGDITPVESQKGYRFVVAKEKTGVKTMTLIIGDQSPHYGAPKFWIDFFGQDTPFLQGPTKIAKRANQALVYPSFNCLGSGRYEITLKTIATGEEVKQLSEIELTRRFAALLEDDIRRQPELWLLSHRRWKHNHADFPNE